MGPVWEIATALPAHLQHPPAKRTSCPCSAPGSGRSDVYPKPCMSADITRPWESPPRPFFAANLRELPSQKPRFRSHLVAFHRLTSNRTGGPAAPKMSVNVSEIPRARPRGDRQNRHYGQNDRQSLTTTARSVSPWAGAEVSALPPRAPVPSSPASAPKHGPMWPRAGQRSRRARRQAGAGSDAPLPARTPLASRGAFASARSSWPTPGRYRRPADPRADRSAALHAGAGASRAPAPRPEAAAPAVGPPP